MINAIVIDDEPLARVLVIEYLQAHKNIKVVEECNDGFEGVKAILKHKPELIFLDIQMPKINGFEMLELIDEKPSVIFTTAFDEYAIKAFETNAIDYLLKPFSKERFSAAIEKWQHKFDNKIAQMNDITIEKLTVQTEERNRIVVKNGNNIKIIPTDEICYIEAYDDYVKIFTNDAYHLKKKTMSYYETVLDGSAFIRVHRSYIVQLNQITKIEPYEKNNHIALLKSKAKIPLSRNGYSRLKDVLGI
jgi:two-component system LytT family response regulator